MLIASTKIPEREGSILLSSFYWSAKEASCYPAFIGARRKHLAIQLLLASVLLLVTCVSLIYLEDEFLFLFLVQLNEMMTLAESKV